MGRRLITSIGSHSVCGVVPDARAQRVKLQGLWEDVDWLHGRYRSWGIDSCNRFEPGRRWSESSRFPFLISEFHYVTGDRNSLRVSLQSLGPLPGRVEYDAPAIVSVET